MSAGLPDDLHQRRQAHEAHIDGLVAFLRAEFPALYDKCEDHVVAWFAGTSTPVVEEDRQAVLRMKVQQLAEPRILRNSALCLSCNTEVTSQDRHDFCICPCGNLSVDGGTDYLKRGWDGRGPGFEERSVYENLEAVRTRLAALSS